MAKDKTKRRTKDAAPSAATIATKPAAAAPTTSEQQSGIWQDPRFQHLVTDPRFKNLPKSQRKVKIDKRFQSMFTDKKFNVKYTVDKYGRRINRSTAEDLKKYYELNSSASEDEEEEDEKDKVEQAVADDDDDDDEEAAALEQRKEEQAISRQTDEESGDEAADNDALESDGEEVPMTLRERLLDPNIDYARGEGRLVTDSSSDDDSTDDEDEIGLKIDHVWGELDNDAETTEESTRRLAVCNMDWDRIRATDLMMLFSSFLPPGGSVLSVKIYPSEFGKQRMEEEERNGPQELVEKNEEKSDKKVDYDSDDEDLVQQQDSDAEEGDDYHMEKLRQYQLNRLRYYYAVVECDSVNSADKIYQECDGHEYESSATKVDLRFIQDDITFDEDVPRDVCTELPDNNSYKPRHFTTTALQQAKVDLTWDETALERRELGDKLASGNLTSVSDADLRKIVAYSSEEEDEEEDEEEENDKVAELPSKEAETIEKPARKPRQKKEDAIAKYKALLAEINEEEQKEKDKKYQMECTWDVGGGKDGAAVLEEDKDSDDDSDSDVVAKQPALTPIEKVLQKRSEKNKKRKEERKKKKRGGHNNDDDSDNNSDTDSDDESVPDGIDLNDPYFAEEFANGDFVAPKSQLKAQKSKNKKKQNKAPAEDEATKLQEQQLQLLIDDDADDDKQHFSLTKILATENETKSKRKRKAQLKKSKSAVAEQRQEVADTFKLNLQDDRFKAVYSSHLYNIDPTDSHFKKTKGMEQLIKEKLKRRHGDEGDKAGSALQSAKEDATTTSLESASKRPKQQLENRMLVKSLKRKIQMKQQQ